MNGSLQPAAHGHPELCQQSDPGQQHPDDNRFGLGTRGVNFDGINVGGALAYDGSLTLSIGAALLNGTYNIFDFASKSGAPRSGGLQRRSVCGTFVYDGTALWTASDTNGSGQTFAFDQISAI